MNEFKLICVSARDWSARGEQYGEQAALEVRMCVETYKEHLSRIKGLEWQDAREESIRYLPIVTAALPGETGMLRGVARSSGVDFEDMMVLNIRYEMLKYTKWLKEQYVAPHAGAWIEILYFSPSATAARVAPHAGARSERK